MTERDETAILRQQVCLDFLKRHRDPVYPCECMWFVSNDTEQFLSLDLTIS